MGQTEKLDNLQKVAVSNIDLIPATITPLLVYRKKIAQSILASPNSDELYKTYANIEFMIKQRLNLV